MLRRIIAALTLMAVTAYVPGCYSSGIAPRDKGLSNPKYRIAKAVTVDGTVVQFETVGHYKPIIKNDKLTGVTTSAVEVAIPLSEIKTVYVQRLDLLKTSVVAFAVVFILAGMVSAITDEPEHTAPVDTLPPIWSCPFVYSHDGSIYVLDGEPYGGSICEGLARTDLCELEHLLAVNGKYRLIVSNELDETQYIDELALLVIDHPPVLGTARTVFAQVSGYYDMHLTATDSVCVDELARIEHEPGYVTRLALEEYLEWSEERQFARAPR
jgi:hypothetical protein